MQVSKVGIDLIKEFEGCYLTAYKCPANVWTIGIGHTGQVDGKPIQVGMTITQQKAEQLLMDSLAKRYESSVRKFKGLNQNQYDALVSFCYNLGPNIFTGNLLKAINDRKWQSVADQMLLYNKARVNGVLTELKGLTRRRQAEVKLFLTPVHIDEEYKQAVTILAREININDAAWYPSPNPKNLTALVQKLGRKLYGISDYKFIITRMKQQEIISNDLIWLEHQYNESHIKSLIKKVVKYL